MFVTLLSFNTLLTMCSSKSGIVELICSKNPCLLAGCASQYVTENLLGGALQNNLEWHSCLISTSPPLKIVESDWPVDFFYSIFI